MMRFKFSTVGKPSCCLLCSSFCVEQFYEKFQFMVALTFTQFLAKLCLWNANGLLRRNVVNAVQNAVWMLFCH